jgi:putative hemolysin
MPSDQLCEETKLGIPSLAAKLAALGNAQEPNCRLQQSPNGFQLENLLINLRVDLRVDAADVTRIPKRGPVVVVANHRFGILDGTILTALLARVRPDVKVMVNVLPADLPELKRHCISVDPFQSDRSVDSHRRALTEALAWLEQEGMLAVFPAGEFPYLQSPGSQTARSAWNHTAARLIRKTGASALPVYFCGRGNVSYQLLGMLHPKLRSVFLSQEFLQQGSRTVKVRVGSEIPGDSLAGIGDDREATEYLRWRTNLLAQRTKPEAYWPAVVRSKFSFKLQESVTPAVPPHLLEQELAQLSSDRLLAENGDLGVYRLRACEAPNLLRELGRLREVTFRQAGEGTGKRQDLDRFDDYYWHVLLWNRATRELVGAYRAGNTAEIFPGHGIAGLYTSTLFRYDARLFEKLGPALELGRSFVRQEYQRLYAPLLLLWKGIARLVASHPETPVLFGAVSISNDYTKASREIIYRFFEARMQDDELAGLIEPRRPFRPGRLRRGDCRAMCQALRTLDDLSQPITDLEADGKGLPILLRQYAKIGGKMVGFNLDRKFSNVLDGLVVVDLRQTASGVLERYMGHDGAARFRYYHCL